MNWSELIDRLRIDDVEVTVKGEKGNFTGFKSGEFTMSGGKMRMTKKPRVYVTFGYEMIAGKSKTAWVPYDMCEFNFKPLPPSQAHKLKIRNYNFTPVIGLGYWRDVYKPDATGFEGVTHNFILPFFRISVGHLIKSVK